ncbi:DUF6192 family protein [Streptomyces sp. NPDC001102]
MKMHPCHQAELVFARSARGGVRCLLRRPDVAFKAMGDDTVGHQANRAGSSAASRPARTSRSSPVALEIREIDRSVAFLELVTGHVRLVGGTDVDGGGSGLTRFLHSVPSAPYQTRPRAITILDIMGLDAYRRLSSHHVHATPGFAAI